MSRRASSSSWPPRPDQRVFTTGEVARFCHVTIRTVIRWFETGELKGYRIPGSRDRRIPRGELVEFMRAHGLPLDELERPTRGRRILIVDDEESILAMLTEFFGGLGLMDVDTAINGYEAGTKTVSFKPDLLLIDYNLGDLTGLDVARTVRANPELSGMKILCMSGYVGDSDVARILEGGVDDFIRKPMDLLDLRGRVYRLLGLT
ncbi:MAG: response regulator [Planctomycetota bacterium]